MLSSTVGLPTLMAYVHDYFEFTCYVVDLAAQLEY